MQTIPLLKSRQFIVTVLDMLISLTIYFVGKYAGAAIEDLRFVITVTQPAIGLLIAAYTVNDVNMAIQRAKFQMYGLERGDVQYQDLLRAWTK